MGLGRQLTLYVGYDKTLVEAQDRGCGWTCYNSHAELQENLKNLKLCKVRYCDLSFSRLA
jgi:hypothetical protein